MRRREPDLNSFLECVKNHEMKVGMDNGLYRHLVFSQPKHRFLYRFEITTVPGLLMISGDMGTWVFSRIEDMFSFFRSKDGSINPHYWSEKLQNGAGGGRDQSKEYVGDCFKQAVIDYLEGYDLEPWQRVEVMEEIERIDFDDQEYYVREQLNDIQFGDFRFQDLWEISGHDYKFHFLWCCYAIVWAINKYDEYKESLNENGN